MLQLLQAFFFTLCVCVCQCTCASTLTKEHLLFLQVVPILTASSNVSAVE